MVDYLLKKKFHVIGLDNMKNGRLKNIKHNLNNRLFSFFKEDILNINKLKKLNLLIILFILLDLGSCTIHRKPKFVY